MMKQNGYFKISLFGTLFFVALALAAPVRVSAHCDTLDGPVIQDARKAIETRNITPVLKWVKPQEEKAVSAAFDKVLAEKAKDREESEHKFFETLVKIHRTGEGAPYTGLKAARTIEPAVAAADRALASGSADTLVKLVVDDVVAGIKARYEHAAATYKHKDESVAQGREFVEAYVAYTHYVERLHQDAASKDAHGEHGKGGAEGNHEEHTKESSHSKH